MTSLSQKHILLGVTGGIAAYKSAELVRRLRESGAQVRVVMTQSATQFVTPLTFQALSGNPVRVGLFDPDAESAMTHIDLARWADAVLVAPATADFMARLAHGQADDLLTTLCIATQVPLYLAPAMNQAMWLHAATQRNAVLLQERGVKLLGPATGGQACGETGPGRMLEVSELIEALGNSFEPGLLRGVHVLLTAGPTREAIDPVRFVSNRSSGKMGFALARAAGEAGATVTLVAGPVALDAPPDVECVRVETAEEMYTQVMQRLAGCDVFIAAAAVADYRPATIAPQKLKKSRQATTLELVRNTDILAAVAKTPDPPFTIGFAAETEKLAEHARTKRMSKSLNMVVANRVGQPGTGFDSDDNAVHVFWEGGDLQLSQVPKERIARQLIRLATEHYNHWKNGTITNGHHAEDTA